MKCCCLFCALQFHPRFQNNCKWLKVSEISVIWCTENNLILDGYPMCCWFGWLHNFVSDPADESKAKHGVWDPMPELTITSPYADSRVDSGSFTMGNPKPESTVTLCQSLLYSPVRDLRFGLWSGFIIKDSALILFVQTYLNQLLLYIHV